MKNWKKLRRQVALSKVEYYELMDYNNLHDSFGELIVYWSNVLDNNGYFANEHDEQTSCGECENYAEWDNGIRWCSVCGMKLS